MVLVFSFADDPVNAQVTWLAAALSPRFNFALRAGRPQGDRRARTASTDAVPRTAPRTRFPLYGTVLVAMRRPGVHPTGFKRLDEVEYAQSWPSGCLSEGGAWPTTECPARWRLPAKNPDAEHSN